MIGVPKPQRVVDYDFRTFVRQQPCLLAAREPCTCGPYLDIVSRRTVTQVCHVKSRGSGGDDRANVWPGCSTHHAEQHRLGTKTFEHKYGVSLKRVAAELWEAYQQEAWTPGATSRGAPHGASEPTRPGARLTEESTHPEPEP